MSLRIQSIEKKFFIQFPCKKFAEPFGITTQFSRFCIPYMCNIWIIIYLLLSFFPIKKIFFCNLFVFWLYFTNYKNKQNMHLNMIIARFQLTLIWVNIKVIF